MPKVSKKRKHASHVSNERILKVLEKLEKRVGKIEKKKSRRASTSSSSSASSYDEFEPEAPEGYMSEPHSASSESSGGEPPDQVEEITAENPVNDTAIRPGLNADILSLLGADVDSGNSYGSPIHQDVGDRWLRIIKKGLDDDGRDELIKKYPSPENAKHFDAPKLNPLVKHAVLELVAKRDERLARQQSQISASLSAIGKSITILLEKEEGGENIQGGNKDIIEHLSDTGRLLADIHHIFSVSRRDLASLNLNKDLKEPLLDSPIDEWLFGDDLNERLKTAKDLQVSSKKLLTSKQPLKKTSFPKKTLNLKSPPKSHQGARRSGHYHQAPINTKYKPRQQYQVRQRKYQDEKNYRRH